MKFTAVILLALLGGAADARTTTASPVEKVVELLTELKNGIIMDGKVEEQMYNKAACWCEKATHAKAEAIERAQQELRALGQEILKLKGKIATLTSEIEELAAAIKDNLESQAEATAVRKKENAEFMAETAETKQAMAALEQAIAVLIKGSDQGSAFLQSTATATIRSVLAVLPKKVNGLDDGQISLLTDLVSGSQQYMPQSLTVQGILVDMYSTFAKDVETATFDEATKNTEYEDFIATKEAELIEMEKVKARKEAEKADAEQSLAEATQSYDDTQAQMKADIAFFDETKAWCQKIHEDWTLRSELREDELAGITKAIEILTSDEAREIFQSAIKPGKEVGAEAKYDTGVDIESFLQISNVNSAEAPASKAYDVLKAQAAHTHSLRLAQIAISVKNAKTGHFDEVIKAIDAMINTLKEEEAADIAKRDQCKEEYFKINGTVADLNWKIKNNLAKIDKLEQLIAKRTEEKMQTIEDIAAVTKEIKDMEDARIAENQEFLAAKKEDQQALELLIEARDVLTGYYKNNSIESGPIQGEVKGLELSQQGPEFAISNTSRPEFELSGKGSRKTQAKGILSIMTMIIEDLNDEIKNSMKAEASTQVEFEKQLKAAQDLKATLEEKKTNLEAAIAKREDEMTTEHEIMDGNEKDVKDEHDYKASIKPDCDWIIGAFEERDKKRAAEMNGLVKAKEFLSNGHLAGSLIQGKSTAIDHKAAQAKKKTLGSIGFLKLAPM